SGDSTPTVAAPVRAAPQPKPASRVQDAPQAVERAADATSRPTPSLQGTDWNALVIQLKLTGLAAALARNCVLEKLTDDEAVLVLASAHGALRTEKNEQRIQAALND